MLDDFRYEADYPHPGHLRALVVHPESSDKPCVLTRRVRVSRSGGSLRFFVSADAAQLGLADVVCRVKIDRKMVYSSEVTSGRRLDASGWREVFIDLGPYADREVTLAIEIAAGGANPWAWEYGFIADLALTGVEASASTPNSAASPAPAARVAREATTATSNATRVSPATAPSGATTRTWHRNWRVSNSGKDVRFSASFDGEGDFPHPGRASLMLHPASPRQPCRVARTVTIPSTGACALRFAVSADAAQLGVADFVLRVRVDGRKMIDEVVGAGPRRAADGWREFKVDLAEFAGRTVKIEIENAGGGASPWAWEYCFLADVVIDGIDR